MTLSRYNRHTMSRVVGFGALVAFGFSLSVVPMLTGAGVADPAIAAVGFAAYATVGGLIVFRRDGHLTGWLLTMLGLAVAVADGIGRQPWAGDVLVGWVSSWGWTAVFALYGALALTFPSGQPPQGATVTARLGRAALVALPVLTFVAATTETLGGPSTGEVTNPVGIFPSSWGIPALLAVVGIFLLATASLVIHRRRSRGVERAQLTWVVFALAVFGVTVCLTFAYIYGSIAFGYGDPGDSAWIVVFLMMTLFPMSFGVAILRYRLFDIDRIISRAVSYTVVAVFLGACYFALVTSLATLVPGPGNWRVAISTLVVAALFNPALRRVRTGVDRRFNRSHFDAQKMVGEFGATFRQETDAGEIAARFAMVVNEAFQPARSAVWVADRPDPPLAFRDGRVHSEASQSRVAPAHRGDPRTADDVRPGET